MTVCLYHMYVRSGPVRGQSSKFVFDYASLLSSN